MMEIYKYPDAQKYGIYRTWQAQVGSGDISVYPKGGAIMYDRAVSSGIYRTYAEQIASGDIKTYIQAQQIR